MEEEFYVLRYDHGGGYAKAIYSNSDAKVKICKMCDGREVSPISNLVVEFKGKKKADYYWVPQHHIIDNKLYKILKENNIKGFNIKDITIYEDFRLEGTLKSFKCDGLQELVVTGRTGYARKLSGILFERCNGCEKILEQKSGIIGLKVNIDEWDGSDIFYFKNLFGMPIVTNKFKEIIENSKVKNIKFINIKDIELM